MKKLFALLILFALTSSIAIPFAMAQNATIPENGENGLLSGETSTILKVVGSWLIYSILGLFASVSTVGPDGKPTPFDARKISRSLIWMGVAAVLAIALNLNPQIVVVEQANLITEIVNFIVNTGIFLPVIYGLDKLYTIATNILAQIKETSEEKP